MPFGVVLPCKVVLIRRPGAAPAMLSSELEEPPSSSASSPTFSTAQLSGAVQLGLPGSAPNGGTLGKGLPFSWLEWPLLLGAFVVGDTRF